MSLSHPLHPAMEARGQDHPPAVVPKHKLAYRRSSIVVRWFEKNIPVAAPFPGASESRESCTCYAGLSKHSEFSG